MYTFVRSMSLKRLSTEQLPAMGLAWLIAEVFYKFRSFTLECLAFLVTWFVIDMVIQLILRRVGRAAEATESAKR